MSSTQSVILGLLEKSSLPKIYKTIITNLLPNMSAIQMNDILATLFKENKLKEIVDMKRVDLYGKYKYIFDKLQNTPEDQIPSLAALVAAARIDEGEETASTSSSKLDSLKYEVKAQGGQAA